MKTLTFLLFACLTSLFSAAQDSTVVYYTGEGKITQHKDSASTYTVFTRQGKLWYGRSYYVKNNILESQGTYAEMDVRKPVGIFDNYSDSGILRSTHVYDKNSEMRSMTSYYPSGKKLSYIEWKKNGGTEQAGWDEAGNIIPGYIVQQEAGFEGGTTAWRRYIERNLDSGIPEKHKAKPGVYTVVVGFRIDKEGKVSDVTAEKVPPGCLPCAVEAVRVIQEGPKWQPAVQHNRKVIYRMRQSITFILEDDTKAGN